MVNVISLGAGKQSSYMLLQALEGKFKYKPDIAVFADTESEPSFVYDYLDWLTIYVKRKYNFDIVRVRHGNLMVDVYEYISGERERVAQLPYRLEDGGILFRQCTREYKIEPIRRFLRKEFPREKIRLWIGISRDEMERMKDSPVKYITHYYPLVEEGISLDKILRWFSLSGLQEPGKSSCLICPFHTDNYWRILKQNFPDDFERACLFDEKIRHYPKIRKKAYLSYHHKPLREIEFQRHPSLFPDMIEECEGLCGI